MLAMWRDKSNARNAPIKLARQEYLKRTAAERAAKSKATRHASHRAWVLRNKERIIAQRIAYRERLNAKLRVRRQTDHLFRVKHAIQGRIPYAIKGGYKAAKTLELLGCSVADLKARLESMFQPGMTWENYGARGWHVDHIRPCASFDLTDPAQRRECFNWRNLQPLWAEDNIRKLDKWQKPATHA
jgi:hypothetical protein